jgi:hypothetical protein
MGFYGGNTKNRPYDLMLYTTHKNSQNGKNVVVVDPFLFYSAIISQLVD